MCPSGSAFANLVDGPRWLEHLKEAGKQERTVKTCERQLGVIAGFFGEDKAPTNSTRF